ncbi:PP2C family protein-serine/threonine phosphatase [Paenibacillus abyssi]|uniref:PPM-type phosphatase domain-containing protein n=1 Tax=Paenibacillus abyssi TaxID=1340531 RepID=A0A917D2G9_9BACL|nr:PP2C family protein-serine/threonine phosphatase [Paenibacillus abyssi]GGG05639.1 hypothetical protein GCM10010916_23340 [Paenibacillus abyssi]
MGANRSAVLLLKLVAVYIAALFGGSLFIFLNNMIIHGRTLNQLLSFNIPFVLLSDLVIAALLLIISCWRLYPVISSWRHPERQVDKGVVFRRLVNFPMELFKGMLIISLLFMMIYHAVEILQGYRTVDTLERLLNLLGSVVRELGIALILAFLLLSASRWLLHGYVVQLNVTTLIGDRRHSAVRFIAVSAFSCFIITFAPAARFIDQSASGLFRLGDFLLLAVIYSVFAIVIFSVYIIGLRKELRLLIDRLYALSRGMKTSLHQQVPITSLEETGRLTDALNALQYRMESAYEEVNQQLKLAYTVQNRLLPKDFPDMNGMEVAVSCQQCHEVGGDFYDVIPLAGQRYCVAIGDVAGKGLPSALLMSAMMTGLRTEAVKGGSAGDILTRLNRHVFQMTQGKLYTTLGLAILDLSSGQVELDYASAGHLDPYLIRSGQVMEWQGSSYPLGMVWDERYQGTLHTLAPGDIFVLYTDGIIESRHASGSMLGFEWWEQQLRQLSPGRELNEQVSEIIGSLEALGQEGPDDDRTLVLLKWHEQE